MVCESSEISVGVSPSTFDWLEHVQEFAVEQMLVLS